MVSKSITRVEERLFADFFWKNLGLSDLQVLNIKVCYKAAHRIEYQFK